MKIKLLLLVFLFATSLKAQNISEFEIEGISLEIVCYNLIMKNIY